MNAGRIYLLAAIAAFSGCFDSSGQHGLGLAGGGGGGRAPVLRPGQPFEGRYIVVVRDNGTDPADVARAAGAAPARVYRHAIRGFASVLSPRALELLQRSPDVELIEPDTEVHASAQTLPTGVDRIEADRNGTSNIDGIDERLNVDVAVLDTGIDLDHPDLNVAGGVHLTKGANRGGDDGHGHGTHVAGTIGALDDDSGVVGVAPGVDLWAVKVLDDRGNGATSDVIAGIDWVTATRGDGDPSNDVAVANMSLGGYGPDDADGQSCGSQNADGTWTYGTASAQHRAICRSVHAGIVYVVAAGNDAIDARTEAPASYDEVITVSALSDFDGQPGGDGDAVAKCRDDLDDTFAYYSNFGHDVDVMAPGTCIYSTNLAGGYTTKTGTSMATPHVAGAAAVEVALRGMATDKAGVDAIRQALLDAATSAPCAAGACADDPDAFDEPLVDLGDADCLGAGDCDDTDPCTTDSCTAGACVHAPTCADGDACTLDACDPATGTCDFSPVSCDDGSACTTDSCDPASGCTNVPVACSDGDLCTADSCDPATGICSFSALSCDDGNACTNDDCDPATGCLNDPIACSDGDACTADACDPATGTCSFPALSCDDGTACTVDSCDPAAGCIVAAVSCDDANLCTADYCDPASGCAASLISCDDGDACTSDSCDAAAGCRNTTDTCGDGDLCTADGCDPVTGACSYSPVSCDDGSACTVDGCDPATGCTSAPTTSCATGDGCCGAGCAPSVDRECCLPAGAACSANADCCNNRCRGNRCR